MSEPQNNLEQEVEAMILAGLEHKPGDDAETEHKEDQERTVIDVDLYRLQNGAILLVPGGADNPLDSKAVESTPPSTSAEELEEYKITHAQTQPLPPLPEEEQDTPPTAPPVKRRLRPTYIFLPLMLLLIFAAGTGTYVYLLPLAATADISITPLARTLHKETTLTIATHPHAGQVQGRQLSSISLTKTKIAPASGRGHDDARAATGEIVFYNTDISPVSIPAGVTFSVSGIDIVTSDAVTIPAAKPPIDSQAVSYAHAIQAGSQGNIPATSIYTHCCSASVIATNVTPFTGGQDARDYSYIQSSDIQNVTQTLLPPLTSQVTSILYKEGHKGESILTPVCEPRTTSSLEPGSEAPAVTVSVTQTCNAVSYQTSSLNQTAISILAHSENLANYAQVGTVQVTVNASTYTKKSAALKVSLTGTWVYSFSPRELTHLKQMIAGMSKEKAEALLQREPGVQQVTVSLSRLDFKDQLPTDTSHIHILLIIVS